MRLRYFSRHGLSITYRLLQSKCVISVPDDALGFYEHNECAILLNAGFLKTNNRLTRKVIFHEMLHWVHMNNEPIYQHVLKLWQSRTTPEEPIVPLMPWNNNKIVGKRDKWMDANGDEYAGRVYDWEKIPIGSEVLTRHLEKLSDPENLARHWNYKSIDGKHHWRAAFLHLIEVLYMYK